MTELDPDARSLVDLARDGADPTDADRRRVLRGLAAALTTTAALSATAGSAAAAAGGAGGAAGGAGAVSAATGGSIVAWLGAGVLVGLTASTAVVVLTRESPSPAVTEAQPAIPVAAPPAPRVEAAQSPRVGSLGASISEPEQKFASPATAPRAPSSTPSDLGAETALLRTAQSALGRGDARAALAALDAHEAQFPSGALTEERLGARVFALCGMGRRAEAAGAARALLDRAPASPLRARVLDSCIREP